MKKFLKIILVIIVFLLGAVAFTLYRNDVPWSADPGHLKRLTVYVTQNIAQSSDTPIFPELRTRSYPVAATEFFDTLIPHLIFLGWDIHMVDKDNLKIHAIVTSPLLQFKDDVHIQLQPVSKQLTNLHIRSASRLGRADYGANLSHILQLYQEIYLMR